MEKRKGEISHFVDEKMTYFLEFLLRANHSMHDILFNVPTVKPLFLLEKLFWSAYFFTRTFIWYSSSMQILIEYNVYVSDHPRKGFYPQKISWNSIILKSSSFLLLSCPFYPHFSSFQQTSANCPQFLEYVLAKTSFVKVEHSVFERPNRNFQIFTQKAKEGIRSST